jgi:hypothetical protein
MKINKESKEKDIQSLFKEHMALMESKFDHFDT